MKIEHCMIVILIGIIIVLYPSSVSSQNSSMGMQEGDALWEERRAAGKVEEAINAYKKVLEVDPEN